jgi:hypothetical protein
MLLYWPNTKQYHDQQTLIPKVFIALDEKYRLATVKTTLINLIMIYYS